jgi:hypothetical protein
MPANPFLSDKNHCLSFGIRLKYAHMHIVSKIVTNAPSNEYAK